jgi:hypothetical protein
MMATHKTWEKEMREIQQIGADNEALNEAKEKVLMTLNPSDPTIENVLMTLNPGDPTIENVLMTLNPGYPTIYSACQILNARHWTAIGQGQRPSDDL